MISLFSIRRHLETHANAKVRRLRLGGYLNVMAFAVPTFGFVSDVPSSCDPEYHWLSSKPFLQSECPH